MKSTGVAAEAKEHELLSLRTRVSEQAQQVGHVRSFLSLIIADARNAS